MSGALAHAGLERCGEIVRLVTTMRGGDRPKGAHEEFVEVSVMPRSMWEPWLVAQGYVKCNINTFLSASTNENDSAQFYLALAHRR